MNSELKVHLGEDLVLDSFSEVIKISTGAISVASAGCDLTLGSPTLEMGAANAAHSLGSLITEPLTEAMETTGVAPVILGGETVLGLRSSGLVL